MKQNCFDPLQFTKKELNMTISYKRRRMAIKKVRNDHPDKHTDGSVGPVACTRRGGREWFVPQRTDNENYCA